MGYLISETTKEEREKIVAESLGNIDAACDGCMSGLVEMYQDYIDGKKELREINWICVWDPDGLKSRAAQMWNIQRVPANYIITPKFEIVGKNLAGQRLEDRLNDLLK